VATVLIFIAVGALMIFGLLGGQAVGFQNWALANAQTGLHAPFVGGLPAILLVFLVAGFSFQGTESVGLAAAETANPGKCVPIAIRNVFWRILMFYVGSIFVAGTLIPFTDPNLLRGDEGIAFSPFTIVFERIPGLGFFAANAMNFVILTSVLSCGNSSLYLSSRMLYALSQSGKAPRWFGTVNRRGVPAAAVWATALVGALAFLSNAVGGQKIYQMLYNFSSLTGFVIWLGIALCHLRFRRAWAAQGRRVEELKFRSRFYPLGAWMAVALFLIVLLGANVDIFLKPTFSWFDLITSYAVVPVFLMLYIGHKLAKKTRMVPLLECKLDPD